MPKRKSNIFKPPSANMGFVQERAPFRLTMLTPGFTSDDAYNSPIRTRYVLHSEADGIVDKYADKICLVSEELPDIYGRSKIAAPEALIAMGAIPIGSMVMSFDHLFNVHEELERFETMGVSLFAGGILSTAPNTEDLQMPSVYIADTVEDMQFVYDYTGELPKEVVDWVNIRSYAADILNCCYIGRGAPAGVNLREQIEAMAEDLGLLKQFVEAVSSGTRTLPDMENVVLPTWQGNMLWDLKIHQHFQKALKQSENFREFFHFSPFVFQSPDMRIVDQEFCNIRTLMREMIYTYEKGEENNIADVIWTQAGPAQLCDALDEIGVLSSIEAYLRGVPFEDVLA